MRPERDATMFSESCRILKKRMLADGIYSLWLDTTKIARAVSPGQFVNLRLPNLFDPFLRRPFSVADTDGSSLRIIFRVRGRLTSLLSRCSEGDFLSLLGPLGKTLPEIRNQEVALIGGGVGIAPLLFLGKDLVKNNRVSFFLGAKTGSELILQDEFLRLKGEGVFFATENGEIGEKGKVLDLFFHYLETRKQRPSLLFASGPIPMYQDLIRLSAFRIPCYAFLEQRMGCGTGLCLACVVRKKGGGYFHICQDGPVLDLNLIEL